MCIYDSSSPVLFLVLKMHFGFQTISAACPYNIFKISFSPAIASQGVSPPRPHFAMHCPNAAGPRAMTVYCDLTDVTYNMMKSSPHKQ